MRDRVLVTSLLLVAVNGLPLAGVVFFDWTVYEVLLLFWAENLVIGLFTVTRFVTLARRKGENRAWFMAPFFLFHYGMFTMVHGIFVVTMFRPDDHAASDFGLMIPFLALLLSHGTSYVLNFIGRREYESVTANEVMVAPYKRIVVLHVTILAGGGLVTYLGSPMAALALLVVLKTAIDVFTHVREHRRKRAAERRERETGRADSHVFRLWESPAAATETAARPATADPDDLVAELRPQLQELEQTRRSLRRGAILRLIAIVLVLLVGVNGAIYLLGGGLDEGLEAVQPFLAFASTAAVMVLFVLSFALFRRAQQKWESEACTVLVPRVAEATGRGLDYRIDVNAREWVQPWVTLGLIRHWNSGGAQHRFSGGRQGLQFEAVHADLKYRSGGKNSSTEQVFSGLLFRVRTDGDVNPGVAVNPNSSVLARALSGQTVPTGDERFDEAFLVGPEEGASVDAGHVRATLPRELREALLTLREVDDKVIAVSVGLKYDALYLALWLSEERRVLGPLRVMQGARFLDVGHVMSGQSRLDSGVRAMLADMELIDRVLAHLQPALQGTGPRSA
ncbi:DUF6498-containing protein [Thioalkalivibrio sp. ALE20]|uniref:DUF6498-containing protein n=1 Tax=Thioalkalivibrio sp. ALE20 TaxID=545275 RepID=UPI000382D13E|nr:DUF6498-containing protein [Thioalkalivibrio sp. ALE20]